MFFTYSAPRLGQRIKAGAAADLTPYVEADADVKKWATETSGIFTYEDKFFSIPTTSEAMFVFANKNVLDDAGVTLPESWTVDEFREMAKSLTKDGAFGTYSPPDVARMSLGPDYWYKDGGKASNFDAPEFRASVQLHRDMIDDGSAFPWTDVLAQDLKAYAQTPFLTEQTILWLNSPYSLRFVNDKEQYPHEFVTTFAPAPVPADVKDPWNGGSINNWLQMNAKTKVADAAWKFIRFWLVDGGQYMLKAGKVPAYAMADQQSVVDGLLGESKDELYDVEAFKKVVFAEGTRLVTDTITTASAEISQIISGLDDRCFIGEISVDDWVNEAKSQSDDAIKNAG